MVPTYNRADLLRPCLESVLAQDLGEEKMEIVVIDDHSTDRPDHVVADVGGGRVTLVAHAQNCGPVPTFNDCLDRARGELVHILHGDDLVHPGFYEEIDRLVRTAPTAGLYATSYDKIDVTGRVVGTRRAVDDATVASAFADGNPFQFCSTVVRRSAYEDHGGFTTSLIHTADLEAWARIGARTGLATSPMVRASYRMFSEQHSAELRRSADNLIDHERAYAILSAHGDLALTDDHLANLRRTARRQAANYEASGDLDAAAANLHYWSERATPTERLRRRLGQFRPSRRQTREQ